MAAYNSIPQMNWRNDTFFQQKLILYLNDEEITENERKAMSMKY